MSRVNKVFLIGNLGADPECRYTTSGNAVCNFRIATETSFGKDENGKPKTMTDWHRIVCFGKLAENCKEYLKKGRLCCVSGRIQYRNWDDKEGVKHYMTEIVAENVEFLSTNRKNEETTEQLDLPELPNDSPSAE